MSGQIKPLLAAALMALCNLASAQSVRWEPDFRFPGTLFPAFAISAAGRDEQGPSDSAQAYGYLGSGELGIRLYQAPAGARIKVQVEVPEVGVTGEIETTAPADLRVKYIVPRLQWSAQRLVAIQQPLSAEAVFRVYADGSLVGEERRPVRVRAITDAPLRACRSPQQCVDYPFIAAAFVNENHPGIDRVLRAALDIPAMPLKTWVGTQQGEQEVLMQVWALWYLFQRNKVTYSSITTVSDSRGDISSQTIRPFSMALRTAQANCIDGTALFASILRKIGIEPMVVLVPGHAFLGFYLTSDHSKVAYLETTMLNTESNPFNQREPGKLGTALAKTLGMDVHMKQSWQSFTAALDEGQRKYSAASASFGKQPGYAVIEIAKARQAGYLPLPL